MIKSIFPTLIYLEELSGVEQTEELHNAVCEQSLHLNRPWPEGVDTSFDFNHREDCFLSNFNLIDFKNIIISHAQQYVNSVSNKHGIVSMSNSFLNIMKKEGFQFSHKHPYSAISGVYYYSAVESDATITFENPNIIADFIDPAGQLLSNTATFMPKTSRLLLFPSWLTHRVNLHTSDLNRIAIAFNFKITWN